MSGMLGSHRLVAIIEVRLHGGCLCTMHWTAVLLKLKLVPVSDSIKNVEYTDDRNFLRYTWVKIILIDEVLTKLLQK